MRKEYNEHEELSTRSHNEEWNSRYQNFYKTGIVQNMEEEGRGGEEGGDGENGRGMRGGNGAMGWEVQGAWEAEGGRQSWDTGMPGFRDSGLEKNDGR